MHSAFFDDAAYAELSDELKAIVRWAARPPREVVYPYPSGQIWATLPGGHKWLNYFSIYEKEFSRWRGRAPRVLEIGVYKGASLKLWKSYFGESSVLVGVDIDPECSQYASPSDQVHVRIGSQGDRDFLRSVAAEFGPFDLIIDDGSHCSSHQIASFNALFDVGLKMQGIYFVEDLECVYWGGRSGQLDQAVSAIDFLKMLIDMQHHVFRHRSYDNFAMHVAEHFEVGDVNKITTILESIRFYRGCAVIHKDLVDFPQGLHL